MAIITLTSDIGPQDYLVGAIKGVLLQLSQEFNIVDISHSLSPFNQPQAAYVCRNAIANFPEYCFHIILVNLFDRRPDQLLMAIHNRQYYLCADNGLLPMIMEEKPEMVIGLPMESKGERNTIECVKRLGKAILGVQNGERLADVGLPDCSYIEKNPLKPLFGEGWLEGQIIFIDNFENVVVNITKNQFEHHRKGRKFHIVFRRDEVIDKISETYADVPEGEKLATFNAAGYLEISINKGNAAGLFGLFGYMDQSKNQFAQNRIFYQTVKIIFV